MGCKKTWFGLGLAGSLALTACGGSDSTINKTEGSENIVSSSDELPDCGKKNADEIYEIKDSDKSYICNAKDKDWIEVVGSVKKLPTCNEKSENKVYYIDVDEEYVVCTEYGEWESLTAEDDSEETKKVSSSSKVKESEPEESSSSKKQDKQSDDDEDDDDEIKSSSSKAKDDENKVIEKHVVRYDTIAGTVVKTDTLKLHQTIVVRDTTYITVTVTKKDEKTGETVAEQQLMPVVKARVSEDLTCGNALFCGKAGDVRVNTGFSDATDTYGWWYTYVDDASGGNSKFTWPHGLNAFGDFVPASVLETAGIQGSIKLGDTYEYPFGGLGFNLKNESQSPVNITDWDGMCVTYYATQPMYLEIHAANEERVTGYNNPKAILPSSFEFSNKNLIADIDWNYFVQEEGWGEKVDLSSVLEKAGSISFKFTGEQESTNSFIIFAIGPKGTCSTINKVPASSSSSAPSSSAATTQTSTDVLKGAGDFAGGTGALTYWTVNRWDELENEHGLVRVITNETEESVLEFYTTDDCAESWYLQIRKDITLEKGYSYQIFIDGYDYGTHLEVPAGLQESKTPYTMITDIPYSWDTREGWASTPYDHCSANKTARIFVNGGMNQSEGFAIKSIKLMKTPITCD